MWNYKLLAAIFVSSTIVGSSPAQSGKEDEKAITRNLRVMVAGNRALPVFEQRGGKVIEVDPHESLIPPTSLGFLDPTHAPRDEDGARESEFSVWPNELIYIKKYKGPSMLQLLVKGAEDEGAEDGEELECKLGKTKDPLVLIHADPSRSGWKKPVVRLLDMDPAKIPARSVTVINLTKVALRIHVSKDGQLVKPMGYKTVRLPRAAKETFRYKIDASDGQDVITVSNSRYRLNQDSRLLVVALPGRKTKHDPFPRPSLRMVVDPVAGR